MFKNGKPAQKNPQFYDEHVNATIPYYQQFHQEIINLVKATGRQPGVWLDTGCGTGTLAAKALPEFEGTLFIIADPSMEMLEVARNKLEDCYAGRCRLLPASKTQDIVLAEGEHPDVITSVLCHHYMHEEGRIRAIQNCYELLKESGLYITFENIRPLSSFGIEMGKANWKNFQVASGKPVDEAEAHLRRFGVEYFPITVEEHLVLLRECGFLVVELFWYSYMQAGFYCIK
ncbi:MAG: class I SAM-dependent methyltransferase [Dehalococcoidia bacterium]|nr:class I SAM-dependent methyltransferase [Dehalococcoidia bacterium]